VQSLWTIHEENSSIPIELRDIANEGERIVSRRRRSRADADTSLMIQRENLGEILA